MLDVETVRPLISAHCADAVGIDLTAPSSVEVKHLPDWIEQFGIVAGGGVLWLWIRPVARSEPPSWTARQLVLDVAPGRYVIETLETATREWVARESAAAAPLVIGLRWSQGPLIVRIAQMQDHWPALSTDPAVGPR
jgi:hypothetical protein